MEGDLEWRLTYDPVGNTLTVSLMGPEWSPPRPPFNDLLCREEIPVDAPEALIDREVERIKGELLERHRTVAALMQKHHGRPA